MAEEKKKKAYGIRGCLGKGCAGATCSAVHSLNPKPFPLCPCYCMCLGRPVCT